MSIGKWLMNYSATYEWKGRKKMYRLRMTECKVKWKVLISRDEIHGLIGMGFGSRQHV